MTFITCYAHTVPFVTPIHLLTKAILSGQNSKMLRVYVWTKVASVNKSMDVTNNAPYAQVLEIQPATKAYNGPNTIINILINIIR